MQLTTGAYGAWKLTLKRPDGTVETGFGSGATLAGAIWPGEDRASLVTPTLSWIDASAGAIKLEVSSAQSAALGPGRYQVQVSITAGGKTTTISSAAGLLEWLDVTASPGSAGALKVYAGLVDLYAYVPALRHFADQLAGTMSNFERERARARSWLDDAILGRDRPRDLIRGRSSKFFGLPLYLAPGYDIPNPWLRDQLAADALIVRDITREIVSRKAAAYACEGQLGSGDVSPIQRLGQREDLKAETLLAGYVAEIDTNGDGAADYWVRVGVASSR